MNGQEGQALDNVHWLRRTRPRSGATRDTLHSKWDIIAVDVCIKWN